MTIAQDIANRYVGSNLAEIIEEILERSVVPTDQHLKDLDSENYSTYEFSDGSTLVVDSIDGPTDIRTR